MPTDASGGGLAGATGGPGAAGPAQRPTGRRSGSADPARRPGRRPAVGSSRGLRRLHRGGHHRPALPRHRRAAAPLVPGQRDRPDHRADAARAGRAGHPVRARPGRRQRPPDRRGRRRRSRWPGSPAGTTAAGSGSASATRSATGSPGTSGGTARWRARRRPGDRVRLRRGERHPRRPAAPRPSRTVDGRRLPRPARRVRAGHRRPSRWPGDPQVVLNPAGGNPAAITALPGLGGALGSVGGRLTAITAELPGQSAQFRTAPLDAPLLIAGAPRVAVSIARLPGQPAPAEAVLFAKTYEVTPDGLRTLLGSAVAPMRVAVPADGTAGDGHRDAARRGGADRGRQPAAGLGQHHRPGLRRHPRARGLAARAGRGRGHACRWCPASRSPPTPSRSGRLIGIGVVLGLALLGWLAGRVLRPPPDRSGGRRPTAGGRCRCATWPRPTRAGSAR